MLDRETINALHQIMTRPVIAPSPSEDDDRILEAVSAAIEQTSGQLCRPKIAVRDGIVSLSGTVKNDVARRAAMVAAENVGGVRQVIDQLGVYPPAEEDLGGGDFVSLQEQPSTTDDEPL